MNTRCLRWSRAISSCVCCVPGDDGEVAPAGVTPVPEACVDPDTAVVAFASAPPEAAVQAAAISVAAANATRIRDVLERILAMAAAGYPTTGRWAGPGRGRRARR